MLKLLGQVESAISLFEPFIARFYGCSTLCLLQIRLPILVGQLAVNFSASFSGIALKGLAALLSSL